MNQKCFANFLGVTSFTSLCRLVFDRIFDPLLLRFKFQPLIFDWGGLVLTFLIILWALIQERNWLRQYLVEEVRLGVLTLNQYETVCSGRKRNGHRLQLLFSRGFKVYRQASR